MELSIIRRETTGAAPNLYNESETITKFEIMDGAPVRGVYRFLLVRDADGPRRDDSDQTVPGRVRTDANVPRRQQEVFDSLLPQPCADR